MDHSIFLRALLKERNITTQYLSVLMDLHPTTVNKKISGKIKFKLSEIEILLSELNMTYEEVFSPTVVRIQKDKSKIIVDGEVFIVTTETKQKVITTIRESEMKYEGAKINI